MNDRRLPFWVSLIVVVAGGLMILGSAIALLRPGMMLAPHDEITNGVRIYAGYLFSRNLVLGGFLFFAFAARRRQALATLLLLCACTQLLDAIVDCIEARWPIVPGVLLLAVALFVASASVSGGTRENEASSG